MHAHFMTVGCGK